MAPNPFDDAIRRMRSSRIVQRPGESVDDAIRRTARGGPRLSARHLEIAEELGVPEGRLEQLDPSSDQAFVESVKRVHADEQREADEAARAFTAAFDGGARQSVPMDSPETSDLFRAAYLAAKEQQAERTLGTPLNVDLARRHFPPNHH